MLAGDSSPWTSAITGIDSMAMGCPASPLLVGLDLRRRLEQAFIAMGQGEEPAV